MLKDIQDQEQLKTVLREKKANLTYDELECEYPSLNRWHLWCLINRDGFTLSKDRQILLGLQVYEETPVCPIHGTVHQYDCRTQAVKPLPKRKKHLPRLAIRKDNMESAARSILANIEPDKVSELVKILSEASRYDETF